MSLMLAYLEKVGVPPEVVENAKKLLLERLAKMGTRGKKKKPEMFTWNVHRVVNKDKRLILMTLKEIMSEQSIVNHHQTEEKFQAFKDSDDLPQATFKVPKEHVTVGKEQNLKGGFRISLETMERIATQAKAF